MCQHDTFVFALFTTSAAGLVGRAGFQVDTKSESLANASVDALGDRNASVRENGS